MRVTPRWCRQFRHAAPYAPAMVLYGGAAGSVAAASLCMIQILEIYAKTDVDARHVQVFAGFYVLVSGLHVGVACTEVYADAGRDSHAAAHGRTHI